MKFICYPKCGTCRKARKWLDANSLSYEFRDISVENPTLEEIKEWQAKSGLPMRRFFNTSGILYREMKLKDKLKSMTDQEMAELLATNGMLVKRPIAVSGDHVLVGFKENEWENVFLG